MNKTKVLLVEGNDENRVIPYLMEENGIIWEKGAEPVYIQSYDGVENMLKPKEISTQLKSPSIEIVGMIVDADDKPENRWESIRNVCLPSMPDFPQELPKTGLIHLTPTGKKFGVWMMPDNKIQGMLETFLAYLIPDITDPLWEYTQEVVTEAQRLEAPFISKHTDKAKIHTWLAWQDPPGRQLHNAIMEKILNPNHPKAEIFVNWFKTLYGV